MKLAVIGCGLIGRKHAELIAAHEACALAGICDLDARAGSVAEARGVPFYQDASAMLERERPDGAVVATPNEQHAATVELCANRSVHVLIEKPIAGTLEDAQRIIQIAEQRGIQVLVGHHRRHNPLIRETRAVVQGGTLGKLVGVSVMWALLKPADYFDVEWRCRRPGGGPTLINLIHEFDSLRYICGQIKQVFAHSSSTARRLEVEDSLAMTIAFANGALGSVLASDVTPAPWSYEATTRENPTYAGVDENCYYFLGTLGSLAFPQMALWRYDPHGPSGWQHPLVTQRLPVERADPLVRQLEHFCRVVRGAEAPIVDGLDGTRSLAVALAALESMRCRKAVEVSAADGLI